MRFLKNHFEKLLVGLVAIGFVVSVGLVSVLFEREQKRAARMTPQAPTGSAVKELESNPDEVIARLDSPKSFAANPRHAFWTLPMKIWMEKNRSGSPVVHYNHFAPPPPPDPITHVSKALRLLEIRKVPFRLKFEGYSVGTGPDGQRQIRVQIRLAGGGESRIKLLGDSVEGFTLLTCREIINPQGKDVSELVVQRGAEPVITLIRGADAVELAATCQAVLTGKQFVVRKNDVFSVELDDPDAPTKRVTVKCIVTDIQPAKLVLIDRAESENETVFEMPASH